MSTTTTHPKHDPYLELFLNVYPLRPIHTPREHQRAKKAMRSLAGDKRRVAAQFKKVLISIIEAYEHETGLQMAAVGITAPDIVRHLLDQRGMSVNAFARETGLSQSALSDMLNGKRDWSKSAILVVADYFGLDPALFLR